MLGHPRGLAREIERPVDLRRQQLLTQPDAPRLWTVVDETALHPPLSGPEVMKAQPEYLIEVSEPPNIALQTIQEMLGHSSIAITSDICTSVLPEVSRDAAEAAARLVPRARAKTSGLTSGSRRAAAKTTPLRIRRRK